MHCQMYNTLATVKLIIYFIIKPNFLCFVVKAIIRKMISAVVNWTSTLTILPTNRKLKTHRLVERPV